jgi:tetratricopeptide (TPR) repeat protein
MYTILAASAHYGSPPYIMLSFIGPHLVHSSHCTHNWAPLSGHAPQMIFLDSLAPSGAAGWQAQGNKHYAAKQYSEAATCYSQALLQLPGEASSMLQDVLLNLSATHLNLAAPGPALQCATAVLPLCSSTSSSNPTSSSGSKLTDASYRAALALDQLGLHHAARYHMILAADYSEEDGCVGSSGTRQQWMAQLQQPTGRVDKVQARQELARALAGMEGLAGAGSIAGAAAQQAAGAAAAGDRQKASSIKEDAALKAAVAQCMSAKQRGDESLEAGEYSAALQCYTGALQALLAAKQLPVLALLNNRAICQLQLGGTHRLQAALQDAVAALALEPTSEKAHYRRTSAALQLSWLQEAAAACQQGLAMVPCSEALQQLKLRLETAAPKAVAEVDNKAGSQPAAASAAGSAGTSSGATSSTKSSAGASTASNSTASGTGSSSGSSSSKPKAKGGKKSRRKAQDNGSSSCAAEHQQITERELRNMMHEGGVGADKLGRTNDMFAAMLRLQPEMRARAEAAGVGVPIDERIARFHEEFAREGRWGACCWVGWGPGGGGQSSSAGTVMPMITCI